LLHSEPEAEAVYDLVPDPVLVVCRDLEGSEETGADRHNGGAEQELRDVVACSLGENTCYYGCDDERHDEWEGVDAGMDGGYAFDGLEPDRDIIYHYHHGAW